MPPPRHPPPPSPSTRLAPALSLPLLMLALLCSAALAAHSPQHDCLSYDVWHHKLDDCKHRAINTGMTTQEVDCLISGGTRFPPDVITVHGAQMQCYNKTDFGDYMADTMVSCVAPELAINNNNNNNHNTMTSTTTTTTTTYTTSYDDDDDDDDDDDGERDYDDDSYYDPQAVQSSPMPVAVHETDYIPRRVPRLPHHNRLTQAPLLPPHAAAQRHSRENARRSGILSRLAHVLRMRMSRRTSISCSSGRHPCCALRGLGGVDKCFDTLCYRQRVYCA